MILAGFFFISDKIAKPSHLTIFNLFSVEKFIPPKGIIPLNTKL